MPADAAASAGRRWLAHPPRRCQVCQGWGRQAVCKACLDRFAPPQPRCPQCALPSPSGLRCGACLQTPPAFSHAVTVADYGFPWDRLIARFKFEQQPELAAPLSALLADAVTQARSHQSAWPVAQAVVPVPLSPQRLAERGYNQAWELARRVATRLGLPARPDVLERWRDTPHQVGASRRERLANLQQAMWVDSPHVREAAGRHLALVDDVLTTGMTAQAASQALLDAGAASVQIWVLARTPAPEP